MPEATLFGIPDAGEHATFEIFSVPFDATASYRRGTAHGPQALLEASSQVDLYDMDFGGVWQSGFHSYPVSQEILERNRESRELVDRIRNANDDDFHVHLMCSHVNKLTASNNRAVYEFSLSALSQHKIPVVLGGDHSVPLGSYKAMDRQFGGHWGILHIDAHCDLRAAYQGFSDSHASIMHNALRDCPGLMRLCQVAIRDFCEEELQTIKASNHRVLTFFDSVLQAALLKGTFSGLCQHIVDCLPQYVYLSVDIDGFDPALCPNTGTPVPGGLQLAQFTCLLRALVASGKQIIGLDLCEVAPAASYIESATLGASFDASVGARVLYKMMGAAQRTLPNQSCTATHLPHPNGIEKFL
jgi:agmatinase